MPSMIDIIILIVIIGALGAATIWAWNKFSSIKAAEQVEYVAFERTALSDSPPAKNSAAPRPAPKATGWDRRLAENAPTEKRPAAADSGPPVTTAESSVPGSLGESVAEKLRIAKLLDGDPRPLRTKSGEVNGTALELRDGTRLAVLESSLERDNPEMALLFRRFDGVVVPGPGADPLFVKRFEYFLSDRISL